MTHFTVNILIHLEENTDEERAIEVVSDLVEYLKEEDGVKRVTVLDAEYVTPLTDARD